MDRMIEEEDSLWSSSQWLQNMCNEYFLPSFIYKRSLWRSFRTKVQHLMILIKCWKITKYETWSYFVCKT